MKQATQEGFIMDVLQNYTSIQSYFNPIGPCGDSRLIASDNSTP